MAVFQVVVKQRLLLQEVRNIFYYETITGNPSGSEWQDIADEIRVELLAELVPSYSDQWSYYGIDYRQVDVSGLPSFSEVPSLGELAGTNVIDSVATQIALLVSVKENTTAPNHCRSYLAGFTEGDMDQSLWKTAARGHGEDYVAFMSVLNAGGTNELQRVSARWNTAHNAVTAYNNVAGATPYSSEVPATQRRRRIGVGI